VAVRPTFEVELSSDVGANVLACGFETEGRAGRRQVSGVHALVSLGLRSDVLFLGDQVVNALFKFHLN